MSKFPHGVLTGKQVQDVFNDAKVNQYALPAVNVTNTSTVNAVLEAAAEVNSPCNYSIFSWRMSIFCRKRIK